MNFKVSSGVSTAIECKTPFALQRSSRTLAVGKFTPSLGPHFKDDLIMATRTLTADDLERIAQLAKDWGKIIVRRAFAEQGPGRDVDLSQGEPIAQAAARGLSAGTLEEATTQQAQLLGDQQPCPVCGHACPVTTADRPIAVAGGTFQHREPVCYCPTCRRDFFPAAAAVKARHARLPSDAAAQDHRHGWRGEIA